MGYTELIGLALAAAGAGTSIAASKQSRDAMNEQVNSSLLQQQQFQQQATPIFQQSLAQSGPKVAGQQVAQGAQDARSLYDAVSKVPNAGSTSPLPVDTQRLSGQVNQARDAGAQQQGYSNFALQQWLKNQEANRNLGVIGNLSTSANANTGILTQLAGQKSAGMAGIGSLLGTAGNLASIYGAVNASRPQLLPSPTGVKATGPYQSVGALDQPGLV
jgi:hypothetical protein